MFGVQLFNASLTAVFGILVYVLGQWVVKFSVEPAQKLLECIGETNFRLTFYANIYCNPGHSTHEEMDKTSKALREQAGHLIAKTNVVRGHRFFMIIGYLPDKKSIDEASSLLIGLSNRVYRGDGTQNDENRQKIQKLLSLDE